MAMKVLLLTTCICNSENLKDLRRLILSINSVTHIQFCHYVLLQNAEQCDENKLLNLASNYQLIFLRQHGIISLSKARNKLIKEVSQQHSFINFDFISCPDDDCWYPPGFWDMFRRLYAIKKFELFYTKFSSTPSIESDNNNVHNFSNLIGYASSNTTFYSAKVFEQVGLFNENFGVGAKNNGGEDLDFAIKASLVSHRIYFLNSMAIGHRDPLPEFRYKYFQGSFAVLNNHKLKSWALYYHFLRKLLIGVVFYCQRKISFSDFKEIK
jgi:GT2 family glycosyltransferase